MKKPWKQFITEMKDISSKYGKLLKSYEKYKEASREKYNKAIKYTVNYRKLMAKINAKRLKDNLNILNTNSKVIKDDKLEILKKLAVAQNVQEGFTALASINQERKSTLVQNFVLSIEKSNFEKYVSKEIEELRKFATGQEKTFKTIVKESENVSERTNQLDSFLKKTCDIDSMAAKLEKTRFPARKLSKSRCRIFETLRKRK